MAATAGEFLKAPFPAFGGKRKAAAEVWRRFGDVRNYVEPFAFSCAVLLNRPGGAGPIETVNDLNSYVANFWRAVQGDPAEVARHADWPVIEDDLHARHRWLVSSDEAQHKLDRVRREPDYFDARIAGWWAWGACCWIGTGWCDTQELRTDGEPREKSPDMDGGRGVLSGPSEQLPHLANSRGQGVNALTPSEQLSHMDTVGRLILSPPSADTHQKRQHLGHRGKGVVAVGPDDAHRPQVADQFSRGRGVNANDQASTVERRREWLTRWILNLADRMRPVRVCCGHWARVCDSDSTMTRLGTTGVFLDPPYRMSLACGTKNRSAHIYANDKHQDVNALCDEVQEWCVRWGDKPDVRIALCGYEGEYPAIVDAGWSCHAWKSGGYGNRTQAGKDNAARERIYFSPACIAPNRTNEQNELFAGAA